MFLIDAQKLQLLELRMLSPDKRRNDRENRRFMDGVRENTKVVGDAQDKMETNDLWWRPLTNRERRKRKKTDHKESGKKVYDSSAIYADHYLYTDLFYEVH